MRSVSEGEVVGRTFAHAAGYGLTQDVRVASVPRALGCGCGAAAGNSFRQVPFSAL